MIVEAANFAGASSRKVGQLSETKYPKRDELGRVLADSSGKQG